MAEKWEFLGGGVSILTNEHCRAGEDALLLARFAAPKTDDVVCDLGTGGGILPLVWCRRDPPAHIDAVEREEAFVQMARVSVRHNCLQTRIRVYLADWNTLEGVLPSRRYTLVTCNPPYFPKGSGRQSGQPLRRAARQEDGNQMLPELFEAAGRLLSQNGRFCLCHRPERLTDVLCGLRDQGLVPRRLQWVQQTGSAPPWLFLCEAGKTGKSGALRVLPPIVTSAGGTHTHVYKRLYGVSPSPIRD